MLPQFQLAVEFRFDAWLNEENGAHTIRFLREREIALVCVDEPQGFRSSIPPLVGVISRLGIVRFQVGMPGHGSQKLPVRMKNSGIYTSGTNWRWLPKIREMANEADELHVIFKNKHADYPVKNARQFSRLLGSGNDRLVL